MSSELFWDLVLQLFVVVMLFLSLLLFVVLVLFFIYMFLSTMVYLLVFEKYSINTWFKFVFRRE
ncbi:hypothetical protein BCR25_05550 [Enterococcus termitis]|uniref:Uncharacterized protein n=1 Tax=Enterococcus termitis TaxID=332950 RepID=A0A1E5GJQ4_9ENTE|nr:hypothetical protein BCR25_05550 [Enterococcus termitis]